MSFFGRVFRVATFGESHGPAIGVVVDGVPPGVPIDEEHIRKELQRRMFCHVRVLNPRCEPEEVEILSGVKDGRAIGSPIAVVIRNRRVVSDYYKELWMRPRPGHADLAYYLKYGAYHDHRGGGRASGRETAARIVAGAIAGKVLEEIGVRVSGYIVELGGLRVSSRPASYEEAEKAWERPLPMLDGDMAETVINMLVKAASDGDSVGGVVEVVTTDVPPGLGEPVFDKLKADLAKAALSIPSAVGVEFGYGFQLARMRGSEANDPIVVKGGRVGLGSDKCGGLLGGLSIGEPIRFRVAFKPTPSIRKPQRTVDLTRMEEEEITFSGRYDVSTAPKALVALIAMTRIVLADHAMLAGLIRRTAWGAYRRPEDA